MNWLTNLWSGNKKSAQPKLRCYSLACPATFKTAEKREQHEQKYHG